MIIIETVSDKYFEINGIQQPKIYQPLKQGSSSISLIQVYNNSVLLNGNSYDEYEIDGVVYGSQALTIAALLPVIYLEDAVFDNSTTNYTGDNITNNITNNPDNVDIEENSSVLRLKNRGNHKFIRSGFDLTTIDNTYASDTIEIRDSFDLDGGVVTMPVGVKIFFNGGKIENGTIIGNGTRIEAGRERIFNTSVNLLGDWNLPEVYPEWFGARNGSPNDTLFIQKAVDVAGIVVENTSVPTVDIVQSVVSFSSGKYILQDEVEIPSGVVLRGAGMHSTYIMHSGSSTAFLCGQIGSVVYYAGNKIERMSIIGDGSNSVYGFRGYNLIRSCHLSEVLFDGFNGSIFLQRCWTFKILNCQGQNARTDNVYWDGATNGRIEGCRFDVAGRYGIIIDDALISTENLTILNSASQFNNNAGIYIENGKNCNILNNFLEGNCKTSGVSRAHLHIDGDGTGQFNVSGNFINQGASGGEGRAGFFIADCKNFNFVGNTCQGMDVGVEIASNVESGCVLNNAHGNVTPILNASAGFINFNIPSRPSVFYGEDMLTANDGLTNAPFVAGKRGSGTVSIATISGIPMIQASGTGTSNRLLLNPYAGKVEIKSLNLNGIPTSAAGLSSGDIWNDSGTLKFA